jgi:hypothetical protein
VKKLGKYEIKTVEGEKFVIDAGEGVSLMIDNTPVELFKKGVFMIAYDGKTYWLQLIKENGKVSCRYSLVKPTEKQIEESEAKYGTLNIAEVTVSNVPIEESESIDTSSEEGKEKLEEIAEKTEKEIRKREEIAKSLEPIKISYEEVKTAQQILQDLRNRCIEKSGSSVFDKASMEECIEYLKTHQDRNEKLPEGTAPLNPTTGGYPNENNQKGYETYKDMVEDLKRKEAVGDSNAKAILDEFWKRFRNETLKTKTSPKINVTDDKNLLERIKEEKKLKRLKQVKEEFEEDV